MEIDADVRSLYNNVFGEMDDNVEREKLYNELIELKVLIFLMPTFLEFQLFFLVNKKIQQKFE